MENAIKYGIFVGEYTEQDLKNKKDKKDLERIKQFYNYANIYAKEIKENNTRKLIVYVL